jgi:hypothetical protein
MSALTAHKPRVQFFKDERYESTINTWPESSVFRKYIESILRGNHEEFIQLMCSINPEHKVFSYLPAIVGGKFCGVNTVRIGESNKFEAQLVADGEHFPLDKNFVLKHMPRKAIDIPMAWLEKDSFRAINSQIMFYKMNGCDINGNPIWIPANELNNSHFLLKCLAMCATSESRDFWKNRIPTLIKFKNYNINAALHAVNKKSNSHCIMPTFYKYGIKEEHGIKGFFKSMASNSLNTIYTDKGVKCFEAPKKAIARDSRLVDTPEAIPYGMQKIFVIYDASHPLVADWFVTGSGYVPTNWIETRGVTRCVSPVGVKMTTTRMPKAMEEAFGDVMVLSKASFKSGINGVYAGITGKTPEEVSVATESEILSVLKSKAVKRTFQGVDIAGFELEVPLFATNIVSLYGIRSKDEEDSEEDVTDSGEMSESLLTSSYYMWAIQQITADPWFDLIGDITERLENGEIRFLSHKINVKTQEFSVAHYSYGPEISDAWTKSVMIKSLSQNNGVSKIRGSVKEALDCQTGNLNFEFYTKHEIENIIRVVYNKICITAGKFDINDLGTQDGVKKIHDKADAQARLDYLLEGGKGWSGLLSEVPKVIKIMAADGQLYQFYIPSGKTMKDYIHAEEGTDRMFFSGPAGDFLKLLLSVRHSAKGGQGGTDWKIKHLNHNAGMQGSMLGKAMDNFSVSGGNYTMLPAPWLDHDEVSVLNHDVSLLDDDVLRKQLPVRDGSRVTFSKMPVLFDKAVADMRMVTTMPIKVFGKTSERMLIAMRNVMFANVDIMLTHQNDTDGDMGRISCTGGILPIYDGLPEYMESWAHDYMEGEYDLKLKYAPYKEYSALELSDGVFESMENKQYIGRATNDLFSISHILSLYVHKDVLDFDHAQLIRGSYACGMQDAIVSGVKHDNAKEGFDFKACNGTALLYSNEMDSDGLNAREELYKMIKYYTKSDLRTVLLDLFSQFDADALNYSSPLKVRRSRDIANYTTFKAPIEDDMKLLDAITNSFVSGVIASQPTFNDWADKSEKQITAKTFLLNTYDVYCDKFMLLGQDLTQHGQGTTLGSVLRIWDEVTSNDYVKSEPTQAELGGALGTGLI